MTSAPTPGPWEIVPPDIEGWHEYGFNIWADAIADEDATLCHDIYSEADARLIAAAPDLLEAAEKVWDARGEFFDGGNVKYYSPLAQSLLALRDAIKKAEGAND